MDSLLIPVLILVLVAAAVLLAVRAWSRRGERTRPAPAPQPDPNSAELARTAAARLTEEQHRQLYALIAQGQAMAAIKVYLEATGEGLRASRDAVAALAAHPQPFRAPEPAPAAVPTAYSAVVMPRSSGRVRRDRCCRDMKDSDSRPPDAAVARRGRGDRMTMARRVS